MAESSVNVNFAYGGSSGIIPAGARNIVMTIAGARGGSGGFDSGGPGGGAGRGRRGTFSIPTSNSDRSWSAYTGSKGSNGPGGSGAAIGGPGGIIDGDGSSNGNGGKGGDDGTSGWSGCGAGGGAASIFRFGNNRVVTAGGGGGGGGGSFSCGGPNRPGGDGGNAGSFSASNSPGLQTGTAGANKGGGDGGGGGGGGGGHTGGGGGGAGTDCNNGGGGGSGGSSRYNSSVMSLTSQGTNNGDGYGSLSYDLKVAEINYFRSDKSSIIAGESANLEWSVSDSESQSINRGIGSVNAVDDIDVSPTGTTTYTLTAIGQAGNDTAQVVLTVYDPVVTNLRADGQNNETSITRGNFANLDWVVSGDANTASINQGIGDVLLVSNQDVNPTTTTTYTLSASGPGGSDSDSVTVRVNQPPELSYNPPLQINYGEDLEIDFDYRYATNGVSITASYTQRNPNNGNQVITTQNISLPGTASDESGAEVTNTATFNVPWTLHGTFAIAFTAVASGGGGSNVQNTSIGVVVDETPDNITIPDNLEELPLDQVEAPDESLVVSDPIVVTDIEVAAEIKSNFPIQVRFDDDDPDIETNWYDVRQI